MVIRLAILEAFILITTLAYVNINANIVVKFIKKNIIAWFGIPKVFITDNGPQFTSQQISELCTKYDIELYRSTPYFPQANGQAKATNSTLPKITKKIVETTKGRDWPDHLVKALWAYQTSIKNSY